MLSEPLNIKNVFSGIKSVFSNTILSRTDDNESADKENEKTTNWLPIISPVFLLRDLLVKPQDAGAEANAPIDAGIIEINSDVPEIGNYPAGEGIIGFPRLLPTLTIVPSLEPENITFETEYNLEGLSHNLDLEASYRIRSDIEDPDDFRHDIHIIDCEVSIPANGVSYKIDINGDLSAGRNGFIEFQLLINRLAYNLTSNLEKVKVRINGVIAPRPDYEETSDVMPVTLTFEIVDGKLR